MTDETPESISEPNYTHEEIVAARRWILLQRQTFRLNLEYASRVDSEFTLRPRDASPDSEE